MHTEVRGAGPTLHGHLKVPDVLVLQDEAGNGAGIGPFFVGVVGKIALKAAWVVGFAVAIGDGAAVGEVEGSGAEVDAYRVAVVSM